MARRKRKRKPGAGRPPHPDSGVSHLRRPPVAARFPVFVRLLIKPELRSLRTRAAYLTLCDAFGKGRERPGRLEEGTFRLVHTSVHDDHLDMIVEASDRTALARGIQGLSIRIARGLNRAWGRTGKVFADRYEDRVLRTPEDVRAVFATALAPPDYGEPPTAAARTKLFTKRR